MPSTVAVIAVPIPISAIMVVAMVPIWIAVVGVPANVDAHLRSSLQIGASQKSGNKQRNGNDGSERFGPAAETGCQGLLWRG
jgi:hypothetical protein